MTWGMRLPQERDHKYLETIAYKTSIVYLHISCPSMKAEKIPRKIASHSVVEYATSKASDIVELVLGSMDL